MINIVKKIIVVLLFIVIGGRLYFLNVLNHEQYKNELYLKTEKFVYGPVAPRGRILDRNGNILVDNKGVKTIYYNKLKDITKKDEIEIAYELASMIDIKIDNKTFKDFWLINNNNGEKLITSDELDLYERRKITSEELKQYKLERVPVEEINDYNELDKKAATIYSLMNKGYSYAPKEIASDLKDDVYGSIIDKNIRGITGVLKWVRTYPYGEILKDVFGSIGSIPKEDREYYKTMGYSLNDTVGISYLEEQYEVYLKGKKDLYKVNSDNTLTLIEEGESGSDLYLSIDINLQNELEKTIKENILKAKKYKYTDYFKESYSIISNPSTGEIRALAGVRLNNNDLKNPEWRNVNTNLITKSYTVGSVVKGASISVGYKYNIIDIDTKMTDSCVKLYMIPIKCSHKSLGRLNDLTALSKSSNYYQFMIAINLTNNKYKYNMKLDTKKEDFDKYRSMYNEYGLGTITNIDLPNEQIGIIGNNYSSDLLLNLAIGQYDTYTPIELSQYINTLGSGGYKRNPSLMQKIVKDGVIIEENKYDVVGSVSIDEKYKDRIKEGLKLAASSGTALGYIDSKYSPAGKTGTSETFIDTNLDGIMDTKTTSIQFVGFAPLDNPEFSIVSIAPNLYVDKNTDYAKYNINRFVTKSISNFYFENS